VLVKNLEEGRSEGQDTALGSAESIDAAGEALGSALLDVPELWALVLVVAREDQEHVEESV
jgi:hypothetical protein